MAWSAGILVMFILLNIIVINSQEEKPTAHPDDLDVWVPSGSTEWDAGMNWNTSEVMAVLNVTGSDSTWSVTVDEGSWTTRGTTPSGDLKHEPDTMSDSDSCRWYKIIVQGFISVIVSFLGMIGNIISILVFWPDRNKSASQAFLLQLAVVDSLVLIIWSVMLVISVVLYNVPNPGDWFLALIPYAYKYGWGIANMIQMVSVWLIVIITVQRYVAVCHPHKMRLLGSAKVAWIQLAVLSVVCVAFNIPRLMEYDIVSRPDGSVGFTSSSLGNNEAYRLWYRSISFYLVIFIIPVGFLIFFTVSLIRQLRASRMKIKAQQNITVPVDDAKNKPAKTDKGKDDITFALIVVDVIFIICQLPNPLRRLVNVFITMEYRVCGTPFAYFAPWSGLGIFVNSATNFLVFCLCGKGFRAKVMQRLCKSYAADNASSFGRSTAVTNAPSQFMSKAK